MSKKRYINLLFYEYNLSEFQSEKCELELIKKIQNVEIGTFKYFFNLELNKYITRPIRIILSRKYNQKNTCDVDLDFISAIESDFNFFDIYVYLKCKKIDYNKMFSMILHKIKHSYDLVYNYKNSFTSLKNLNKFRNKHNIDNFISFLQLLNYGIYFDLYKDKNIYSDLKWLKTYNYDEIEKEFKKTYTYENIIKLKIFESENFIKMFDKYNLIEITNDFIKIYSDHNMRIKNILELENFYKFWEDYFMNISNSFENSSKKIIDEIIDEKKNIKNRICIDEFEEYDEKKKYEDKWIEIFVSKLNELKNYKNNQNCHE